MSLIDPREKEARRNAKYQGTPTALIATLLLGLAALTTTALIGFGIGGFVDQFRVMSLNSVFSTWDTAIPVWLRGWALPIGIVGSIIMLGAYGTWNHRYSGRTDGFAFLGPLPIVLLGLTLGSWYATTLWTQPDAVGVAVDPTFGQNESWDAGAWIIYAAQWWLPGIFALLTLLTLLSRLGAQKRRRLNDALATSLLRSGAQVEAEIVDAPLREPNSSRMIAEITARFEDTEGASRWVKAMVIVPTKQFPTTGSRRPLLFDPADAGNIERILLSPTGGTKPGDFVSVSAAD